MAQVHELNISNWQKLAQTTAIPRWQFNIQIKYVNDAGVAQEHNGTYTFPGVLAGVPDAVMREWVQEWIQRLAYHQLGIQSYEVGG